MCKKVVYWVALGMAMSSVGNGAAIVWTGAGADNLWSNPANWEGNKVPTGSDDAMVEVPGAAAPNGPIIQDGIDAQCDKLINEVAGEPTMTMTGGTLTITGWGIWWGDGANCFATFNQSGGTVTLAGSPGIHEFAWGGASGTWIMTGGVVNAKGVKLTTDSGVYGKLLIHGGTYNIGTARGGLDMEDGDGLIDITEGTLILEGDETVKINNLFAEGKITAYGGDGRLQVDYNLRNLDMTTVTAQGTRKASHERPAHEALDVPRDVVFNWAPGVFAPPVKGHTVYLGSDFNDVNGAMNGVAQDANSYAPDPRLAFGQTYYWRVDEVNAAPDNTVHQGEVWHFTVEPYSYSLENITVTASGSFGISGPENTINGSGLSDDLHGVSAADMWISGGIPATIEYAFDRAYKLHELWIWNSNQLIEAFVGFGAKDVVIEYALDGENWTVLDGVGPLARGAGTEGYAQNNTIDFGGAMAQRVRLTINSVQGIAPQASLSEVRFFFIPVNAREPQPADGGSADSVNANLRWRSGREAAEHEVVLSQDRAAVADGSAGALVLQESRYTPDPLLYSETYYWQVTETNLVSTPPRHEGPIWSFMAPEYLTIDDFESYADEPFLEIWDTWVDGFEDPGNGAIVGNVNEPERVLVSQGVKSMPIHYNNSTAPISAATRTFDPPQDWTVGSPTILSLHVRGDATNDAQPMYVTVTDRSGQSVTVYYKDGDSAATVSDVFEPWIIPLADLAPVSLSSIESISIGVGMPGGTPSGALGTAYVDLLRVGTPLP